MTMKPRSESLTAKSWQGGLQPQRLLIFIRLQTILQSAEHRAEHQAIENALAGLRVLKRHKLGFPDWEKK